MLEAERFEEFASLISGIHGNIQKLKARYASQLGLKVVHIFWIYLLRAHPEGLSASELAAAGQSDRSLVSREIDYLFKEGVIRTPDGVSGRRYGWKLTLTEKGEELADFISAVAADVQGAVSREIPEAELAIFYRTLRTLAGGFGRLAKGGAEIGHSDT